MNRKHSKNDQNYNVIEFHRLADFAISPTTFITQMLFRDYVNQFKKKLVTS